ncbi:hypothetical protein CHGG_00286 [Chaetomium globosum CBS 148.51]|uniref:HTH araC/xylS-type domain-containing protein n=1 Tax=Chaetomium globosum (strain ATCC 6205 / CBS 148.51 / DSM 1962 / NBRC 6347 / NRRL 1970) TaxID=306901 RepID=Q2HHL8_CHAGB|nr:uncharacterized protein CHGG_00286 [Chaetomium globosum CBS 148.51]EAQ92051.1 hypothetical protein CHGG_00286 [Chaetomium globosum CBS 148.51]
MFETPHSRWRALEMRNPRAASAFLYGVKTTHIYCRPTCPSRLARKANVVFFDSVDEAACAGFRACKRCKPSQADFEPQASHKKAVQKACELMDTAQGVLTLESLAASVGLSPRYLHGVFKTVMGFTPNAYAMKVRKERSTRKRSLRQEGDPACLPEERSPPNREDDEGTALPCKTAEHPCEYGLATNPSAIKHWTFRSTIYHSARTLRLARLHRGRLHTEMLETGTNTQAPSRARPSPITFLFPS